MRKSPIEEFSPVEDDILRICKVCKEQKQLNLEFNYHSGTRCYSGYCKDCANKRRNLKYAGLPLPPEYDILKKIPKKRIVFENKPYRKTHYYNRKRIDYKAQDRKKGYISDLTSEFIQKSFESPCVYCGFPAITLDRIDNNLGHTIANCVPACYECNIARNKLFSYEEMIILGKCIKEIKESRENYNPSKSIFPRLKQQ